MNNSYNMLYKVRENQLYLSPFVNHVFGKVARIVERVAWESFPANRPQNCVESFFPFPRLSPQNMFMKIRRFSLNLGPFPQIHAPYY